MGVNDGFSGPFAEQVRKRKTLERAPAVEVPPHNMRDHLDFDQREFAAGDVVGYRSDSRFGRGSAGGGGLLSLLTMRNTAAQTWNGGYSEHPVNFNVTDTESFGSGLAYEANNGIVITANGWYQVVCNLHVVIGGTVGGEEGPIRVALRRFAGGRQVGANSTYAKNEDTWFGAASRPFLVTGDYDEISMRLTHDILDGGAGTTLSDSETGDTFLSAFRIA